MCPSPEAMWTHGWNYFPCEHRERIDWGWHGQSFRLLVHRDEEERFFGDADLMMRPRWERRFFMPIRLRKKIPGSLLIVPSHSLDHINYDYDEESYFSTLDPFIRKFEHVAACIHPSCAQKGIWLSALRRRSIPWTLGAEVVDRNGLRRIRGLFEQFSHVTSNSIGSHIPYAASCNCSVSIYGPRQDLRPSDWCNHPYYKEHPQILEWMVNLHNSRYVEKTFGWLFREPTTDANDRDWALQQLGHSNMKTPIQLAELFGWDIPDSTSNQTEGSGRLNAVRRLLRLFDRFATKKS